MRDNFYTIWYKCSNCKAKFSKEFLYGQKADEYITCFHCGVTGNGHEKIGREEIKESVGNKKILLKG